MKEYHTPSLTRNGIDTLKYGGLWIAIYKREIIDSDESAERLIERMRACGLEAKAPILRVPRPGVRWM